LLQNAGMLPLIAPSLLSADFGNLERDIHMINRSEADWFHLDIMDGVFVPNISYGFPVIETVHNLARKPLDVHLMIVQPERYFERFKEAGAAVLSIHYEASTHLHRSVQQIKSLGMKAGVVINPHTPVALLRDILPDADLVLVMSVNPGYGGQSFIRNSIVKIRDLAALKAELNPDLLIEVDGGVSLKNAPELSKAGANVLVAGNTVFRSENPEETIQKLKQSGSH
jgi:ribulose-phosphate 3-epimerase